MKKKSFILILLGLLLLAGCTLGKDNSTSSVDDWSLDKDRENLYSKAEKISKTGKPSDLVDYLNANFIRMGSDELTGSIYLLNNMQKKHIKDYDEHIAKREYVGLLNDYMEKKDKPEFKNTEEIESFFSGMSDEDLEKMVIEAYSGGYKLIKSKGVYRFIIDYDQYEKYENNALSEIKTYLAIQKEDQDFKMEGDLSFEKLADKLVSLEKQLLTYKDGYGYEELLRIYSEDFRLLLEGNKDNPIVDEENKIRLDILNVYEYLSLKDTVTSEALNKYIKIIKESNRVMTQEVRDSIITIHNEVIALLEK